MFRPTNRPPHGVSRQAQRKSAGRPQRRHSLERLETRQLMSADVVLRWNHTTLDAIRAADVSPPIASRSLAVVHAAIFDAVNSIDRSSTAFAFDYIAPPTASKEAAASVAAERVLAQLFPSRTAIFAAQLSEILATVPDGLNEDAGVRVGQLAADAILALRDDDGSDAIVAYTPGSAVGDWQTTPPANGAALLPQWSLVMPFVLDTADQFKDPLGLPQVPLLSSPEYAAAYEEVKVLGSAGSESRTADQTEIAHFWANGVGTATPPGHLNVMAQVISIARSATLEQNAKLFAQLNLALADTAIAVWDLKFDTNLWRPITAIRAGDLDGNDSTSADATWTPLITTPPFPAYVSGHAAFSAAAASVLKSFFGTDEISFTLASETSNAEDRMFTSISQAAQESALSRLYAGVHWNFDNHDGLELGDAIGDFVSAQTLATVIAPTTIGLHDGVLIVVGTDRAEKIQVVARGNQLEIMINGKRRERIDLTAVESISIDAKGGNDTVELIGRVYVPASIEGGAGNDRLVGGWGNDSISGGPGHDVIHAGRGDDWLAGGGGNDLIRGDIGNDTVLGGAGNDRLFGDAGFDSLEGGLGNDILYGGIGNDLLSGNDGNDILYGGSGHDALSGDDGNDKLYGEAGRDMLDGGLANDLLVGGGQDDLLEGGPGRNNVRR